MKDMQKAVSRIQAAFQQKEKILVFGDYDVDGTTSVACMFQFLCSIYDKQLLDFYIPHRYREGYGISKQGIDFAKANGFTLIISLDCGIKSVELIAYAKELGIDFDYDRLSKMPEKATFSRAVNGIRQSISQAKQIVTFSGKHYLLINAYVS